ncbi:MAG TPA: MFS transporter [Gemmatimonadaceae bacterium]|nr:MFS transporter [Gemmatimonadaceae bacterium]
MTPALDTQLRDATIRKVSWRLLPLLFVLFIASFLDRTNLGVASLQMNADLALSATAYALGAGVFYFGYALFEVPSNLILARVGARVWIARIAITWGFAASAMMFVRGETSFYALRFLLGLAEAGFFPGIVWYLGRWFPERERARAMSWFMIGIPLAGVIGGPIGGLLLSLNGQLGLAGWKWLFLLEGVPPIVLGLIALRYLTDSPEKAEWLTAEEREWLVGEMHRERSAGAGAERADVRRSLTSGLTWFISIIYLFALSAELGPIFFGPILVRDALHLGDAGTGLVIGAIGIAGVAGMIANGAHSDRTGERRLHSVIPLIVVAVGFAMIAGGSPALVIAGLVTVAIGINAFLPAFWCIPSAMFTGTAAAAAIALINSIGNLGGYLGPTLLGKAKDATGSYTAGMLALGALALAAAAMLLWPRKLSPRD